MLYSPLRLTFEPSCEKFLQLQRWTMPWFWPLNSPFWWSLAKENFSVKTQMAAVLSTGEKWKMFQANAKSLYTKIGNKNQTNNSIKVFWLWLIIKGFYSLILPYLNQYNLILSRMNKVSALIRSSNVGKDGWNSNHWREIFVTKKKGKNFRPQSFDFRSKIFWFTVS